MATQFTAIGIPYPPATDNNDTVGAIAALAAFIDPIIKNSYTQAQIDAFAGATQLWGGTPGVQQHSQHVSVVQRCRMG